MSALILANAIPASSAPSAEFRVSRGTNSIARIGVHAGGTARIPTVADEHNDIAVGTAEPWDIFAIVNGITTSSVTTTNPNATITAVDNNDDGYSLQVS